MNDRNMGNIGTASQRNPVIIHEIIDKSSFII